MSKLRLGAALGTVTGLLLFLCPPPAVAAGAFDFAMSLPSPERFRPRDAAPDRSYRVTLTSPRYGIVAVTADWENHRYKVIATQDSATTLTYVVGSVLYQRDRSGEWIKEDSLRAVPAASAATHASRPAKSVRKPATESPLRRLPNRFVNGVLMTAFAYRAPAARFDPRATAGETITIICLADERAGRLRSCAAGPLFSAKFDRYNDASNRVVVPEAALHAKDITNTVMSARDHWRVLPVLAVRSIQRRIAGLRIVHGLIGDEHPSAHRFRVIAQRTGGALLRVVAGVVAKKKPHDARDGIRPQILVVETHGARIGGGQRGRHVAREQANGLKQKDLAELVGSKGIASEIINGKRGISRSLAEIFVKRFNVPYRLFL